MPLPQENNLSGCFSWNALRITYAQFIKVFSQPRMSALLQNLTLPGEDFFFFSPIHIFRRWGLWWIHYYWWLHIASELLQSASMVIVTEVICIKLIIPSNKAHKSGHYQFSWKCFNQLLFHRVQGKIKGFSPFFSLQMMELICERIKRHLFLTVVLLW